MSKILVIGDLHFRERLRYADYIEDRREGEKAAVLDALVAYADSCDSVVLMGDCFDTKNNVSSVVRDFTAFVERFDGKTVYALAGNHEKMASGKTALDYLAEINNPNWHIITTEVAPIGPYLFVPYFYRQELGCATYAEATDELMARIREAQAKDKNIRYLFTHHAISDTLVHSGQDTNLFQEIVLPKTELEGLFDYVIGGHIHQPRQYGKTIVTGSTFSNEVGDVDKAAWQLDTKKGVVEMLPLPVRPIVKVENPTAEQLLAMPYRGAILKIVITEKGLPEEEIKVAAAEFDAFIWMEQIPNERKKMDIERGAVEEFSVEDLLHIYAQTKKVDEAKLRSAWELIKQ